jgi:hypothetical protein
MKYRKFGKLDFQVSALGFGAMRLPVLDKDQNRINEPEAVKMIHYAFDHGVNYIDTAYPYHGGTSEGVVGRALKGYRDKVRLATKLAVWAVQTAQDFDRLLNEQLGKLQTEHIDFYLLHGLNKGRWPFLVDLDVFGWAEKAIQDGRIGHLGFSFHDDLEVFKKIVDAYDRWTLCQIQYNFMDIEYQAGTEGLRYAADKGLAVVVMEPIRGGQLARVPPPDIAAIWDAAPTKRSPAEWALQWVWNQPEVSVALSGMSAMRHVTENVASAERSGVGSLTPEESALIDQVREQFKTRSAIPCTACRYCMPCPNNVNIPGIFGLYNDAIIYDDLRRARMLYRIRIPEAERAELCQACQDCEELCPQALPISEWMGKCRELLEQAP